MPRWLFSFFMLIVLLIPTAAYSQDVPRFSMLEVDLWPEYDRPSVLVIYRITLPAETSLPADLALRIPAAAGEPNAVAVRQPDGQLFSVDYKTENEGDWRIVTFTATLREVQIEYYDPNLEQDGDQRKFRFNWSGDYDIEQMIMQVQLPVGATDMRITPGPVSSQVLGDGMTYYFKEIGSVTKGQTFSINLAYQKKSDLLSVESLQVQPSAPLSPTNTWQDQLQAALPWLFPKDGSNQILPWALGILALALIFGGGYWYWRSGREEPVAKRRRGRRPAAATATPQTLEAGGVYCHQCGKRASPGDVFCRSCGTRLRTE